MAMHSPSPHPVPAAGTSGSIRLGRGETIVVVDDTTEILELLADLLTDEGFRVVPCPDPLGALEMVAAEQPALVIVDLKMAGIHGLALVDAVVADPRTRGTPFLVCSGAVPEIHAAEARIRSLGGDVLEKPFELERLLTKVGALIGRSLQE